MTDKSPKPKKEITTYIYPDWNQMANIALDVYFLKHEVKRLMKTNDSLEWRSQLAYTFGWADCKQGEPFDAAFHIDNIGTDNNPDIFIDDVDVDDLPGGKDGPLL